MYAKPSNPISFDKDKSIYAVDDFCAFMNWMCTAFFNMTDSEAQNGKNGVKTCKSD